MISNMNALPSLLVNQIAMRIIGLRFAPSARSRIAMASEREFA